MPFKSRKTKLAYSRRYYRENREHHVEQAMIRRTRRRKEIKQWIAEFKIGKSCARCPEADPACLDFHHRRQANKTVEICYVRRRGWSQKRLMQEIAKCDLLCANCHRKEHARQRQSCA